MNRILLIVATLLFGAVLSSTGCRDVPVDPETVGPNPNDTVVVVDHRFDTTWTENEMVVIDTTFRHIQVKGVPDRTDTIVTSNTLARPPRDRSLILYLINHRSEVDSVVIDVRSFIEFDVTSMATRRAPGTIRLELAMPVGRYIKPERFRMTGLTLVHLNFIDVRTALGDTTALTEDPEERNGAAISYERKRLATGDVVSGRKTVGWVTMTGIDTNRRFIRLRMHTDFQRYRDGTPWPDQPVPIDLALHLGY